MNRSNHSNTPSTRGLSMVEALCLIIVLLVVVFMGKGILGNRAASSEQLATATGFKNVSAHQASVVPTRKANLVYRSADSGGSANEASFEEDDDFYAEDDLWADEAEAAPAKPTQLIQLRPVEDGEVDPFNTLQETSLDPGPVAARTSSTSTLSSSSRAPATSKAIKAYQKAQKLKGNGKGSKYVGKGSVKNARGKSGKKRGTLADNQGDQTLPTGDQEPELVDPQAQLNSFYEALKNPEVSTSGLRKYMDNLTAAELPAALEAIGQQPASSRTTYAVDSLFRAWGKTDPIGALDYADAYESIRTRNSAIASTLGAWATERPHEALNWYLDNLESDPRAKQLSVGHVFRELAKVDLNDALINARGLPDERMRQSAYNYIFEGIEKDQRVSTLDNLYHMAATSQERKEIANLVVRDQVRYEPHEAARYVTNLDDPEAQHAALNTLVTYWSTDRPDQAIEFVSRINDSELREKHMGTTMRNWVRYDPEVALTWLDGQAPSPDLDSAFSGAAYNFRENDPEEALYWAEQIQDEKKQTSNIRSVAKNWLKTDPERARAYIATSPAFSDKDRARYLGTPPPPAR